MNNKGFAITGILYGVLLLFLMVLISLLSVLVFRLNRFTTLVDEVSGDMENKNIVASDKIDEYNANITSDGYFQTPYRGKYTFKVNGTTTECYAYLPKNIVIKKVGTSLNYLESDNEGNIDVTQDGTPLTLIGCTNPSVNSFSIKNIETSANS